MNATEAAIKMEKKYRCVIIGLPATDDSRVEIGDETPKFAGQRLMGYQLKVVRRATREEWDRQATALFGERGPSIHPPARGQRFYACKLVKEETAA